jgi:hypothetical protein
MNVIALSGKQFMMSTGGVLIGGSSQKDAHDSFSDAKGRALVNDRCTMEDASESTEPSGNERNMGLQPLDALMTELGVSNHQLVATCTEPLTHKAVQRARKGRKLTRHMQRRMVDALNTWSKSTGADRAWREEELFNYRA